jgi:hypothetical protein
LNEQANHIAYMINHVRENALSSIEATLEGEDGWVTEMQSKGRIGRRFFAECTPGYYNDEGKLNNPLGFFTSSYGGGTTKFFKILEDWRTEGALEGAEVR